MIRGETHDNTTDETEPVTNADRDDDSVLIVDPQRPTSRLAGKQLPPIASERRHEVRPVEAVEVDDLVHSYPRLRVELADRVPPLRRDSHDGRSERPQIEREGALTGEASNPLTTACWARVRREPQSLRLNTETLGT